MSYFIPYLDATGIHLPTYEDRLSQLLSDYRSIFGNDITLTEATMDYQLLSVFAKALDDMSSLLLDAYTSRNPNFATGQALDLLLSLNGIHRNPGESDAEVRLRRSDAVTAAAQSIAEGIVSAVKAVPNVTYCKLFENDTDTADDHGFPAHSVTVLVQGGTSSAIAKAIYNKKAPGVATNGTTAYNFTDPFGNTIPIRFSRPTNSTCTGRIIVTPLTGWNATTMIPLIQNAVAARISALTVGEKLIVPSLYSDIYNAVGGYPFAISSVIFSGASQSSSELITPAYNQRLTTQPAYIQVLEAV